jgi:hypothetical protein
LAEKERNAKLQVELEEHKSHKEEIEENLK